MTSRISMSSSAAAVGSVAEGPAGAEEAASFSSSGACLGRSFGLPDGRADMDPPAPEYRLRDRAAQQSGEEAGDVLDQRQGAVVFHAGRAEDADPAGAPLPRLIGGGDEGHPPGRQVPRL